MKNGFVPRACDVVVVGMGPVGLILANLLGAAGLEVLVFERSERLNSLPRAIAYDDETLRILASVDLLTTVQPCLITGLKARFLNARGHVLMEVEPHDTMHGHSALGTFHQPSLEAAMLAGCARFPNVTMRFAHEVLSYVQSADDVALVVRDLNAGDSMIRTKFVVGCDGGASRTREAIGAELVGSSATQRWLVVDTVVPGHTVDSITFYCDPARPTVEVPAYGQRIRWEFLKAPLETDEFLLDRATIRTLVSRHVDPDTVTFERSALYTFRSLVADTWGRGRILLAGDAAHMMPPFAGQGMNSGFKDASNLAWKLEHVLRRGSPDALLASYEEERRGPAIRMVRVSQTLGPVIMARHVSVARMRDALFGVANRVPAFRDNTRKGGLRSVSSIARSRFFASSSGRGSRTMMPQPHVRTVHDTRLLDRALADNRWALIGLETDPRRVLDERDRTLLKRFDVAYLRLDAGDDHPSTPDRATVSDRRFIEWMRAQRAVGVLVRPDRFIAHRVNDRDGLAALRALASTSDPTKKPERMMTRTNHLPWRRNSMLHSGEPLAKATSLAYVRFERPDLQKAERFLNDFGLVTVSADERALFLRGSSAQPFVYAVERGPKARVRGLGFDVAAREDLDRLAAAFGRTVEPNSELGGGSIVRLTCPGGLSIDVLHDREMLAPLPQRERIVHNAPGVNERINVTQRPPLEAPLVVRLGHAVIETTDFDSVFSWFRRTLGMIPSDVLGLDDDTPAAAFLRFDLGTTPADHHSVFVTMGLEERLDHVAFEVLDLDAVQMGQQVLRERDYVHAWGVGRHRLGSQIFDYWRDPWQQKHEHYADGDLFDATFPTGYHPMDRAGLYQWGPDLPPDFIDARMTPGRISRLFVRGFKDRTLLARFGRLKQAMSAPGRPWTAKR